MARITAPIEGFRGTVGGVQFEDSVAETDNLAVIAYCTSAGYTVELEEAGVPDESWTVAKLTEWAAAHDVELGGAAKKADILATIAEQTSLL